MKKLVFISLVIFTRAYVVSGNYDHFSMFDGYRQEYSDDYDYRHEKELKSMGRFTITIGEHSIVFDSVHGKIDAPLRYKRDVSDFNFDGCYKIAGNDGKPHYFRFGWMEFKNKKTVFSDVHWLKKGRPVSGVYEIRRVQLSLKQKGRLKICTVGDSQTWWNEAGNLRRYLDSLYPNLYFAGSRIDVNGYPHEGEGGNHSDQVLARLSFIPVANFYTLLLGTNDWRGSIDSSFTNITTICNRLLSKSSNATILYITPLPTTNKLRDEFNTKLAERLIESFKANSRIEVLDIGNAMRKNINWATDYFPDDGLHQNKQGVLFMATMIADYIEGRKK